MGVQPALAGMKHCNRLEQVLARAEWDDPACDDPRADEGLMRSVDGDVVCATAANLFILRHGRWWTPPVDR
jgi:4-amino-4-deoxychorismate lyase